MKDVMFNQLHHQLDVYTSHPIY